MKNLSRISKGALNYMMKPYYAHIADEFSAAFPPPGNCKLEQIKKMAPEQIQSLSQIEKIPLQGKTIDDHRAYLYADLRKKYRANFYAKLMAEGKNVIVDHLMVDYWQTQLEQVKQ